MISNNNLQLLLGMNQYKNYSSSKLMTSNLHSLNKYKNENLKFEYFQNKRDSISISETAKQLSLKYKEANSIKKVSNKQIRSLESINNTLSFQVDSYYNFETKNGEKIVLTTDKHGHVTMPFSEMGIDTDSITKPHLKEIDRIEKFFTYLSSDSSALLVNLNYKENEAKDILSRVGIEPGFFKIKTGSKTNEFYLLDNGKIYSKHQSEGHRLAFNTSNFFKDGYTKNSLFIIDGKEFKLNDDGYLNIPEGTACLAETIKIIT